MKPEIRKPVEEHLRRVWPDPIFQWGNHDMTLTVIVRGENGGEREIVSAIEFLADQTKLVTDDRVGTPAGGLTLELVYACLSANAKVKALQLMFRVGEVANG